LKALNEFKICRRAPGVSHLLFAKGSLVFFQANTKQAGVIKAAMGIFEVGSGQLVNPSKCSILFSEACNQQTQDDIKAILEVQHSTFEEKYLGLPTPEGRMKAPRFQPIKERFRKRLTDWSEKFTSMAAKEALIKSVAQALAIFAMGVFKMPVEFHEDYMQMIRKLWCERMRKRERYIGPLGIFLPLQKPWVVWVLKTPNCSIKHSLHAKPGDYLTDQIHRVLACRNLNITQMAIF
jgi:hypothetical protein